MFSAHVENTPTPSSYGEFRALVVISHDEMKTDFEAIIPGGNSGLGVHFDFIHASELPRRFIAEPLGDRLIILWKLSFDHQQRHQWLSELEPLLFDASAIEFLPNDDQIDLVFPSPSYAFFSASETSTAHLLSEIRLWKEQRKLAHSQYEAQILLNDLSLWMSSGQLISGILHEINNPLTVLQTQQFNLLRGLETEKYGLSQRIDKCRDLGKTVESFSHLIQTLRHSFLLRREQPQNPFSLNATLTTAIKLTQHTLIGHQVQLKSELLKDDFELTQQEHSLSQALACLISMICHLPLKDESRSISLTAHHKNDELALSLCFQSELDRLPSPLERLWSFNRSLCRKVAALHGGHFRWLSKEDGGTSMTFTLPTKRSPETPSFRMLIATQESRWARLLVDSLPEKLFSITTTLGHRRSAEVLAQQKFDVVISDIADAQGQMIDFFSAAREASSRSAVICLTASEFSSRHSPPLPQVSYLRKPFSSDELLALVKNLLNEQVSNSLV